MLQGYRSLGTVSVGQMAVRLSAEVILVFCGRVRRESSPSLEHESPAQPRPKLLAGSTALVASVCGAGISPRWPLGRAVGELHPRVLREGGGGVVVRRTDLNLPFLPAQLEPEHATWMFSTRGGPSGVSRLSLQQSSLLLLPRSRFLLTCSDQTQVGSTRPPDL